MTKHRKQTGPQSMLVARLINRNVAYKEDMVYMSYTGKRLSQILVNQMFVQLENNIYTTIRDYKEE